jgi:hypothetical protein
MRKSQRSTPRVSGSARRYGARSDRTEHAAPMEEEDGYSDHEKSFPVHHRYDDGTTSSRYAGSESEGDVDNVRSIEAEMELEIIRRVESARRWSCCIQSMLAFTTVGCASVAAVFMFLWYEAQKNSCFGVTKGAAGH